MGLHLISGLVVVEAVKTDKDTHDTTCACHFLLNSFISHFRRSALAYGWAPERVGVAGGGMSQRELYGLFIIIVILIGGWGPTRVCAPGMGATNQLSRPGCARNG